MKLGSKLTKEYLEKLYVQEQLSLNQIGTKVGCRNTNVLYWLRKFGIKRRPAYRKKIEIPKQVLEELYWKRNLSTTEIAKKFGIKNDRTIRKKLEKYGILRKTVSQALTKKFKGPFSENAVEKAYLLGLRAGDFHARFARRSIRIQTTTTHKAQIELMKNAFERYGEIRKVIMKNRDALEWFVYVDLLPSFEFLLKKPTRLPPWIFDDVEAFYAFFAAYVDCEGNWNITRNHDKLRAVLRIRSADLEILRNFKMKLESQKLFAAMRLDRKQGTLSPYGASANDIYELTLNRKSDVRFIIKRMLPLSKHSEKIRKMEFVLQNMGRDWSHVEAGREKIRHDIRSELLKNQPTTLTTTSAN